MARRHAITGHGGGRNGGGRTRSGVLEQSKLGRSPLFRRLTQDAQHPLVAGGIEVLHDLEVILLGNHFLEQAGGTLAAENASVAKTPRAPVGCPVPPAKRLARINGTRAGRQRTVEPGRGEI